VLPELILDFRAAHPGVDVALEVGNRRLVWERLQDREADLAVGGRPAAGSGFSGESFRPNDLVIVVPAAMTFPREPVRPQGLAGTTWLLREQGSGTRATAEEFLARAGVAPATLTIGSNGAIVESVAAGLGITLISHDAVRRALRAGDVRILEVRGLPLRRAWHVLTRAGEHLQGAPAAFRDFLRAGGAASRTGTTNSGEPGAKGTSRHRG
jgi:LysR family transcriptional regulator, low CO2-responsive transcriptional regulator